MTMELKLSEKHAILMVRKVMTGQIIWDFNYNPEIFNFLFFSSYFKDIFDRIYAFDNKGHLCKENNLETDGIPSSKCLWLDLNTLPE